MELEATSFESSREISRPRPHWRKIARRTCKYLFLAFLAIVMCLTIVTWWRSYSHVDQLHGVLWNDDHRLLVASIEGRFVATEYQLDLLERLMPGKKGCWALCTNPIEQIPETHSMAVQVFRTLRVEHPNQTGWLVMRDIANHALPNLFSMKLLWNAERPNIRLANYHGLIVPHWMILVFCGTVFALVLRGGRFSLRMLLVGVTLLCVLLATVVKIDRGVPEKAKTEVMHER